jgi:hypothetical protein
VDSHFEKIPCFRTFSVGCLTGRDLEDLGWETDGALDAEVLRLCALDELTANLLESLNFLGGQSDADFVDFLDVTY